MSELDAILPSVKMQPFPRIEHVSHQPHPTFAVLECPFCCGTDDIYNMDDESRHYKVTYCPGNQPPEVTHNHPLTGEKHTHPMFCAGVLEAHFHVQCECCGGPFLLSTPRKL